MHLPISLYLSHPSALQQHKRWWQLVGSGICIIPALFLSKLQSSSAYRRYWLEGKSSALKNCLALPLLCSSSLSLSRRRQLHSSTLSHKQHKKWVPHTRGGPEHGHRATELHNNSFPISYILLYGVMHLTCFHSDSLSPYITIKLVSGLCISFLYETRVDIHT